jgi:hypothetical protein
MGTSRGLRVRFAPAARVGVLGSCPTGRVLALVPLVAVLATALLAGSGRSARDAVAAARNLVVVGPSFAGTGTPTGTKRAESVVWWNDGFWWAVMWDARSDDFHLFRFELGSHAWRDTKTVVDRRANTRADVLWDGAHLYVATHRTVRDMQPAAPGPASFLYRFSYSRRDRRYQLDQGFPAVINRYRTETLVLERDPSGTLWATWQQDSRIYLNHSIDSAGRSWGTPFALPFPEAQVTVDDISSLVVVRGGVGIMWSNQQPGQDAFWFSRHSNGAPPSLWRAPEPTLAGSRSADDHINLKGDSRGAVYAAVKTSNIHADPLILLLVRSPNGGWARYTYGSANGCDNRPVVVIDEQRERLHMFATGPSPTTESCTTSGGAIYEKDTPLATLSFITGSGELVLNDAAAPFLHNASVSKRNVPDTAGMLVLTVNEKTKQYWTLYETS